MPDREKAKRIIYEIVKQAGRPMTKDEIRAAFYLAHLDYAKEHCEELEELSDWPIIKRECNYCREDK